MQGYQMNSYNALLHHNIGQVGAIPCGIIKCSTDIQAQHHNRGYHPQSSVAQSNGVKKQCSPVCTFTTACQGVLEYYVAYCFLMCRTPTVDIAVIAIYRVDNG